MELANEVRLAVKNHTEYSTAYDFEVFDLPWLLESAEKWRPWMLLSVGLYLLGVYWGQRWMKNRPAYDLTFPLFAWNTVLALFSIVATVRGLPEVIFFLSQPNGLFEAACNRKSHSYATAFWAILFLLSKFVEFGDTVFIILRKQKLIILHWYHHVATLVLCWIGFEYYDAVGRFFVLNTFVHSFMYSYYALRAIKVHIPSKISKALTLLQIAQMFFGVYVSLSIGYWMVFKGTCKRPWQILLPVASVVISFTILFINFYKTRYFIKPKVNGKRL